MLCVVGVHKVIFVCDCGGQRTRRERERKKGQMRGEILEWYEQVRPQGGFSIAIKTYLCSVRLLLLHPFT